MELLSQAPGNFGAPRLQILAKPLVFVGWQEKCPYGIDALIRSPSVYMRGVLLMLRNSTSTLAACAMAATVSLFAQEPAPAQQEKQAAAKETVSGCVVEAKTTEGSTVYVLNNAEGGSGTMYVLAGPAQSEWPTNVSKKVEVTGPVQQPSERPAEDGASGKPKALRPPVIEVESVKVIAETCR